MSREICGNLLKVMVFYSFPGFWLGYFSCISLYFPVEQGKIAQTGSPRTASSASPSQGLHLWPHVGLAPPQQNQRLGEGRLRLQRR